jgi:hypothetical protein
MFLPAMGAMRFDDGIRQISKIVFLDLNAGGKILPAVRACHQYNAHVARPIKAKSAAYRSLK